jgi:hypothetical protein
MSKDLNLLNPGFYNLPPSTTIMDEFPWLELPEDGLPFYGTVIAASLITLYVLFRFSYDSEAAINYTVSPPSQIHPDWKGETLEKPSIKVSPIGCSSDFILMLGTGSQIFRNPMLLPGDWTTSRPR